MTGKKSRDHGGNLDEAIKAFGGTRNAWSDLSTGINPVPFAVPDLSQTAWTSLPLQSDQQALVSAARTFWNVPDAAHVIAAPGASALIARIPFLGGPGRVRIEPPTYNEHAAAFASGNWQVVESGPADAQVVVHPNNPDGRLTRAADLNTPFTIIDESFCDVMPDASLIELSARPGVIVLKSFGKFWGLAGLRLGFAIGDPSLLHRLAEALGPWPVSGPALQIGHAALCDQNWAQTTRARLTNDAARLDRLMQRVGAETVGGTSLFRLYRVDDCAAWQTRLARARVWSRVFPYSDHLLRLGLPAPDRWDQIEAAL